MSTKMRKFLDKPVKSYKQPIKEVVEAIPMQNLINESVKIKNVDKETIYYNIEHPGNKTYVLQTYNDTHNEQDRTIWFSRTMGTGNRVIVIFYSGLEEISDFIIEMCDNMGWRFISGIQEDTEKIKFEIFVV